MYVFLLSIEISLNKRHFYTISTNTMAPSYLTITLTASAVFAAWNVYVDYRQRKRTFSTDPKVIERAKTVLGIDEEEYKKAQAYSRDKLSFSMVTKVIDLVLNSAFLITKGFPLMWNLSQQLPGAASSGFLHGLYFSIAAEIVSTIVSLPQSYYSAFVVEARHGFNKQTQKVFWTDAIKGFLLKVGLLHPITNALLHFAVKYFGDSFPNYLFVGAAVLLVAFTYIFPAFIQPLFNKFTPLPEGELKDGINSLATKLKFPLTKVYEVDGSKRSAHSNAYFFGFFNNKRIVLYDTLLKQLEKNEILAVLSHEFGHWYHNHTLFMLGTGLAQVLSLCHLLKLSLFDTKLLTDFGFSLSNTMDGKHMNPVLGFQLMTMVLVAPVMEVLSVLVHAMSRKFEFQADRFAMERMQFGTELRTALVKISKENKGNANPDWLYAMVHYSHPPMVERLAAIDAYLRKSE